jgi:hypothetical protein
MRPRREATVKLLATSRRQITDTTAPSSATMSNRWRTASVVSSAARPLSAQALSDLLDRKPHLLRPLTAQLLPPPAAIDPAERLGIDRLSLRPAEDCRQMLATVLGAAVRGEITPGNGARIARRVRARLRAVSRLITRPAADRVPTR